MQSPRSKKNPWEDHYTQKARKDHFPARSVFKLQEIQQKVNLIQKGNSVLDLGCSPGSWLMLAATLTGPAGNVVGVDLKPVTVSLPSHVRVFIADMLALPDEISDAIGREFHVVISDMAPSTTGNRYVDATRSFDLSQAALTTAQNRLLPGGAFVCKIFQGEDFNQFIQRIKSLFNLHRIFKPQSSRKASREIYIIGLNKR
ncbi:MAG: RlmE family RNA methyltransferase [Burkholderiaceae bacterium]|jgi:23S rRNA (uridine2552-2'-O)-methyltransferase|nr:RlmE family RNA methyltransferase [Burkholderiaceae bacterium]